MRTISANMSKDENLAIDEYCKNNKITKSDLAKESINEKMNHNPSKIIKTPDIIEKITNASIDTIDIKKAVAEIEKRGKIKKEIEPQIKNQTKDEILNHLKFKTNCNPNCEICSVRNDIKKKQVCKNKKTKIQNT